MVTSSVSNAREACGEDVTIARSMASARKAIWSLAMSVRAASWWAMLARTWMQLDFARTSNSGVGGWRRFAE